MYEYSENIFFGGFKELKESENIREFIVINLSNSDKYYYDEWIPLKDGVYDNGGNTQQEFAEAVNVVRDYLRTDSAIFVHCAMGQSRSISVLATAISAEENCSFETVVDELIEIRNSSTEPSSSLQNKAEVYLRHDCSSC